MKRRPIVVILALMGISLSQAGCSLGEIARQFFIHSTYDIVDEFLFDNGALFDVVEDDPVSNGEDCAQNPETGRFEC